MFNPQPSPNPDSAWDFSMFEEFTPDADKKLTTIIIAIMNAQAEYMHFTDHFNTSNYDYMKGYFSLCEDPVYLNSLFAAENLKVDYLNMTAYFTKMNCMCYVYSYFCRYGDKMKEHAERFLREIDPKADDVTEKVLDLLNSTHSFFRSHVSDYLKKVVDFLMNEAMIVKVKQKRIYEFMYNILALVDPNKLNLFVLYHEEYEYITVGLKPKINVYGKLEYLSPVSISISCP